MTDKKIPLSMKYGIINSYVILRTEYSYTHISKNLLTKNDYFIICGFVITIILLLHMVQVCFVTRIKWKLIRINGS